MPLSNAHFSPHGSAGAGEKETCWREQAIWRPLTILKKIEGPWQSNCGVHLQSIRFNQLLFLSYRRGELEVTTGNLQLWIRANRKHRWSGTHPVLGWA